MQILLTNDDGISSPGILLLAESLRNAGHRVFIVAPDRNRSGCSHSLTFLSEPVKLTETEKDTWVCSGTPADCLYVGLLGGIPALDITNTDGAINKETKPDLVLSGINNSANLGTDIIYSGTAAGARQGSFFGIPSAALSLAETGGPLHWQPAISFIMENLQEIISYWKPGTFVNINLPNTGKKPSALVPAFPSIRYYNDRMVTFAAPDGSKYCFAELGRIEDEILEGSDWSEVNKNNASLSVIISQPAVLGGMVGKN